MNFKKRLEMIERGLSMSYKDTNFYCLRIIHDGVFREDCPTEKEHTNRLINRGIKGGLILTLCGKDCDYHTECQGR